MREAEFERRQRRAVVVGRWLAGESPAGIAAALDLSVASVRRIIATTPGARAERAARDAEVEKARIARLREQVTAWSAEHPGVPLDGVAAEWGSSPTELRTLLGGRAGLHRTPSPRPRVSDEQITTAITAHVAATGDTRAAGYDQAARARGWPSLSTATARFGTWRAALVAAGITVEPGHGRGCVYSDAELRDWANRYLAQADRPGWRDMTTWIHAHQGPSRSLLRNRLGDWNTILNSHQATGRQTR